MTKHPYLSPRDRYGMIYLKTAKRFRELALYLEEEPNCVYEYLPENGFQQLLHDRGSTARYRTERYEAYGYGDPGVILASPGPGLAGLVIQELGTERIQDKFFTEVTEKRMKTFFALTEPEVGSNAADIKCQLIRGQSEYYLNGSKAFFGQSTQANTGVVFAKLHEGPLGMRAVWLPEAVLFHDSVKRDSFPMAGLKAANLGWIEFDNTPVPAEYVLGTQKRPIEMGMMSVIKTFNRLRTGVGAMAIGQAQALLDYVYTSGVPLSEVYDHAYYALVAARSMLETSAVEVDDDAFNVASVSCAKAFAVETAENVVKACIEMLPPQTMLLEPWVGKCYRDSHAWEFMEGTRPMQRLNVLAAQRRKFKEVA